MELSPRDRRVLEALVRCHIDTGEAVSSLWLATRGRFGISSATLRNILARLEESGYVRQPHTSAGRVPTDRGYRVHVDQLLSSRRSSRTAPAVELRIREAGTLDDALVEVSNELSRASHHIGFVLAPAPETATLQHIDFVPLDSGRILVVVVAGGGQITHKVVALDDQFTSAELQEAANYLNAEFTGLTLAEVRDAVVARMHEERSLYDALMARALRLAQTTLEEFGPANPLFVQGASMLVDELAADAAKAREEEARALEALRTLFRMIEEKHRLIRLLSSYLEMPGLTIVIGSEHAAPELEPFSVVASTYEAGGRIGAVGVIGPTRMRYSRAISLVDAVARAITVREEDA
ncbi:MAG TPA: heat-inducible transcriptional repressor HrcA [Vicinamibacterales bacterium]|nr:heat-inducible transcriptional repressor HrcA [Vicinamibacterales bacterium]